MDSNIGFNSQSVLVDSILVEDIGNCALEAVDDLGSYHYLIIKTISGMAHVLSFGPVVPDLNVFPKNYELSYYYTTYTDTKLEKAIQKWALGPKGVNYEQLNQVDPSDALRNCLNAQVIFSEIN